MWLWAIFAVSALNVNFCGLQCSLRFKKQLFAVAVVSWSCDAVAVHKRWSAQGSGVNFIVNRFWVVYGTSVAVLREKRLQDKKVEVGRYSFNCFMWPQRHRHAVLHRYGALQRFLATAHWHCSYLGRIWEISCFRRTLSQRIINTRA